MFLFVLRYQKVTRDNISETRNVAIMADNMIPPDQIMTAGVTGGCGGCGGCGA